MAARRTKEGLVSISKSRKSRAETLPAVSKIRRTQRRPVEAAMLHGRPFRGNTANLVRRRFLHLAAGAAALPAVSCDPEAQSYPSRPITMIVPYAAGGGSDVIARNVAERMKASLGQPVIIENITGASGTIGTGRVAHARPDGYMLGIGNVNTHVMNGAAFALQYDVANDFEPVALLTTAPFLLLAKKALPADDLKGLIAWLKANPDKASVGIGGTAGLDQIAGILFQKKTGTRLGFVPYRGGAPALQDLMAGQIDLAILDPPTSLPAVRAGLVKAYAV